MGFLGLIMGLFGLDMFLKGDIESQKDENFPRDLEGSGGKVRIYKNHNDGFCFGFLKNRPDVVKMIPIVFTSAAAGILSWLLSRKGENVRKTGFSLIVAGAASNLFDRVVRGYVVDYFSFQVGILRKVVFNIGDLCIFFGTVIVAVRDLYGD